MRRLLLAAVMGLSACTGGDSAGMSHNEATRVNPDAARIVAAETDCRRLSGMVDTASATWEALSRDEKVGHLGDLQRATMALAVDRMEELGCP